MQDFCNNNRLELQLINHFSLHQLKTDNMQKLVLIVLFSLAIFVGNAQEYAYPMQDYTPTAENLESRKEFQEMRFGMFIHWGLYSQMGGIWKGVKMEDSGFPGPGVSEWLMFKFQIPRKAEDKFPSHVD